MFSRMYTWSQKRGIFHVHTREELLRLAKIPISEPSRRLAAAILWVGNKRAGETHARLSFFNASTKFRSRVMALKMFGTLEHYGRASARYVYVVGRRCQWPRAVAVLTWRGGGGDKAARFCKHWDKISRLRNSDTLASTCYRNLLTGAGDAIVNTARCTCRSPLSDVVRD